MKRELVSVRRIARHGPRRVARMTFLAAARRLTPAVGVEHPAGIFILPSDDLTVRRKLFLDGSRSEFVVLERVVSTLVDLGQTPVGGAFVDVGANLGTTTLAAVQLHGFARAVACEPDPMSAAFLRATVAVNRLDGVVTVVEAAMSDTPGRARFGVRAATRQGQKSGTGSLRPSERAGLVDVEVATLDMLVERGLVRAEGTGLVWLDVQGHEAHVLEGGRELFAARVPAVVAIRPRRLARAEGLERLTRVVAESFSEFVDVRTPTLKPGWAPERRQVVELGGLIRAGRSTDVLLLP